MKRINCPRCGQELIRLEPYESNSNLSEFWCNKCDIDIEITDNKLFVEKGE